MDNNAITPDDALAFYSSLVSSRETLQKELQEEIDKAIPQEVKDHIEDIKAEIQPKLDRISQEIQLYEGRLKEYVLTVQGTLKGEHHMVVWSKGRTSWDTKSLEGYAKAHPELLVFKTEGNPSVSIRRR
jgi:hypothetical protein